MRLSISSLVLLAIALNTDAAPPTPLDQHHPIIGTWIYTMADGSCSETYHMHQNGTSFVTSGEEVSESNFEISDTPSENGFYKWVDVIAKDNGKNDCTGSIMQIGHESTSYIFFHPSGELMVVCQDESLNACFGPLKKVPESGT